MKKILVATEKPFAPIAVDGIRNVVENAGYTLVLLEKYTTVDQLLAAVSDVDAMIVRSDLVTAQVLDAAKKLKIVVRAGAGYDNLDLAACTANGVVAMNTPGQNSNAVAELALGMMVMMARGQYNGKSGTELRGKTLGIHAYGAVGKLVAQIGKGFGMSVFAYDPYVSEDEMVKGGVKPVPTVEKLYSSCQYVSLHIPANEFTRKSIDHELLSHLPANGVLVNTARKEVIDEVGLMEVMAEKPDFKYLSDIAPDCAASMAEKFSGRYFFTPKKMGAQTEEANVNAGIAAAEQIRDFFEKGDKSFQINK